MAAGQSGGGGEGRREGQAGVFIQVDGSGPGRRRRQAGGPGRGGPGRSNSFYTSRWQRARGGGGEAGGPGRGGPGRQFLVDGRRARQEEGQAGVTVFIQVDGSGPGRRRRRGRRARQRMARPESQFLYKSRRRQAEEGQAEEGQAGGGPGRSRRTVAGSKR